jgi:hypothetical protein
VLGSVLSGPAWAGKAHPVSSMSGRPFFKFDVVAESTGGASCLARSDGDQVLRATQRSADRQKTLAAHGALSSDGRLPMTTVDIRNLTSIEGRILVHRSSRWIVRKRFRKSS